MMSDEPFLPSLSTVFLCAALLVGGYAGASDVLPEFANEPIQPVPLRTAVDPKRAELGKMLFHDPRLSSDNTVSCARCHPLNRGGADGMPRSVGVQGRTGTINTPTVLNSSLNFLQFWDGRADTLEAQIDGPIHNPLEMATDWPSVVAKLRDDPDYPQRFSAAFGAPVSADAVKQAIAEYERTLLTPDAPFDRYLRGDTGAISAQQLAGYELFKSYGCSSCHQGAAVGGNMFEKMGIMGDYFANRGNINPADYGRFNVTGVEENRYEFKVPGLRNVELTAPYFHDGSATTLGDAVRVMGRYQLGRTIPADDVERIVAFLTSLTGKQPEGQ